jgi:hypothetical protein
MKRHLYLCAALSGAVWLVATTYAQAAGCDSSGNWREGDVSGRKVARIDARNESADGTWTGKIGSDSTTLNEKFAKLWSNDYSNAAKTITQTVDFGNSGNSNTAQCTVKFEVRVTGSGGPAGDSSAATEIRFVSNTCTVSENSPVKVQCDRNFNPSKARMTVKLTLAHK